ncbi:MAG TPA: glycosyltransferase [Patescibacteria group bacterium]|nr:glycosyltransferase [Patescibacteria group bacterium]
MDKIVIVMPAWNEAGNISEMIETLVKKEFPTIKADMQLLIVDNHSTDGMTEAVEKYSKKYKNVKIIQQENKGLGWAYVSGFKHAMSEMKADGVLEMDADFQHPPRFVKPMVGAYLNGADYVIGSRYIPGGSVPKEWETTRKATSFFGNLFIRLALLNFKIHDLTTGFRLSKVKGILDKIDLDNLMELNRFAYKVDLLYQSLKLSKKTVEVPLEFASRTKEKSKFNYKEMISTFRVAIILGIKDKQKFLKFAVVGGIGFVIQTVVFEVLGVFTKVLSPSIATLLGGELAVISNFTLNNIWTFKSDQVKGVKIIWKFIQFNLTSFIALGIQFVILKIGEGVANGNKLIINAFYLGAIVIVMITNYIVYNKIIWRTKSLN